MLKQVNPKLAVTVGVLVAAGLVLLWWMRTDSTVSDSTSNANSEVPQFLQRDFPDTDFSQVDPKLSEAQSGGPSKDGIPAIDSPKFEPLDAREHADELQAIVLVDGEQTKVYPYNILVWHEIVNDEHKGQPVSVTFCPLCGSAAVFKAEVDGSSTSFGVSGALIESNMVMYDRATESLWQQSTGEALAGVAYPSELELVEFQLLQFKDIRKQYPQARILSPDTGYSRDYQRNPYSGYEDSDEFIFAPSSTDERYRAKTIFVALEVDDRAVAAPWLQLESAQTYEFMVGEEELTFVKDASGQLQVTTQSGKSVPFYFEMWFSWVVQNPDGVVFDPS